MTTIKAFILLVSFLVSSAIFAQSFRTVEASYTYYAPESVSLERAKQIASERAKTQALADAFGTMVSQINTTVIDAKNGDSQTAFNSLSSTEVRGEWLETIYEKYDDPVFANGMIIIVCHVRGKAREIVNAEIGYDVHVLRNGIEDKFESDSFRSGDDLFLSFRTPIEGYLAVYLIDDNGDAFCLLPYRSQANGVYKVSANRRYVFFSRDICEAEELPIVDEYTLTCEKSFENNYLCVVFSSNSFAKALDDGMNEKLPRQLSFRAFNNWLVKCRKRDRDMSTRMIPIIIKR